MIIKDLLTYAKPREHGSQHLLRSNLPANLPDMVQRLAYVLRDELRGDSGGKGLAAAGEGGEGFAEGLVVAQVGDERGGGRGAEVGGGGGEGRGDFERGIVLNGGGDGLIGPVRMLYGRVVQL